MPRCVCSMKSSCASRICAGDDVPVSDDISESCQGRGPRLLAVVTSNVSLPAMNVTLTRCAGAAAWPPELEFRIELPVHQAPPEALCMLSAGWLPEPPRGVLL